MIEHKQALSIAESKEFIEDKEISKFAKGFVSMKPEKAKELRKELEDLNLIKLNPKHISKIIDFLPEDREDLNKILPDTNLDENEANDVLSKIKQFK
ncbi:MAG: hypothetical protein KC516_01985 [Nanoarchaeota archaeon]|nr:hypothetical protein [Nanoarchaeota archaeon]